MDPRESERRKLLEAVDADAPSARALACWMAEHPELALAEHEASARYRAWLSERGLLPPRPLRKPKAVPPPQQPNLF